MIKRFYLIDMKNRQTGRYINYHLQHLLSQKRSIVYGLTDRALLLSHPKFQEKNLMHAINTLLNYCFPLSFIFATINTRIKMLTNRVVNESNNNNQLSQIKQKIFFIIPYVRSISESFLSITKKYRFDIAYSVPNTLNKFIKRGKDKIDSKSQNDCVYKINCSNCDMSYMGQTKRQLGT